MTALLAVLVGFDFTFYVLFHFSFFLNQYPLTRERVLHGSGLVFFV